jgi:hypothetical protein
MRLMTMGDLFTKIYRRMSKAAVIHLTSDGDRG